MDLDLACMDGVDGGAGVAVQKHVIASWLAGLKGRRIHLRAAAASGVEQQKQIGTTLPVP